MPRAGRDEHRVAWADLARIALDFHLAPAVEEDVDLLGLRVVVALRGPARVQAGLREALVGGPAEGGVEQDSDRRAVERRECLGAVTGENFLPHICTSQGRHSQWSR